MPDNVVEIIVRTKDETNFAQIRRNAEQLGDDIGKGFEDKFAERIVNLRTRVRESINRAGSDIGDALGDHIGRRASERIREHVSRAGGGQPRDERGRFTSGARSGGIPGDDAGDKSFLSRMSSLGEKAGDQLSQGIGDRIRSFLTGGLRAILVVSLSGLAFVIAVPLASLITSAILLALGGGVIALGVVAAFKDPRIKAAAGDLGDKLGTLFGKFGEHFRGPVADFLEDASRLLDKMAPSLDKLGEKLAPLAEQLGDGIIGMLQNMLPGVIDALENAEPIIEVLADRLPDIGQALGDFFRIIGDQGDDASVFFNDLITVIIILIRWIGRIISGFTSMYANMRRTIRNGIDLFWDLLAAVRDTFDRIWAKIKSVWDRMGGAARTAGRVVLQVIGSIRSAIGSVSFSGLLDRARNVASTIGGLVGSMFAHGGIVGAATGGIRSGMQWVGEQGPELVKLPAGSTVHSASDSQRMYRGGAGGGGGATEVLLSAKPSAVRDLMSVLIDSLQYECRTRYEGKAQKMFGAAGVPA